MSPAPGEAVRRHCARVPEQLPTTTLPIDEDATPSWTRRPVLNPCRLKRKTLLDTRSRSQCCRKSLLLSCAIAGPVGRAETASCGSLADLIWTSEVDWALAVELSASTAASARNTSASGENL
jgi:hypothetical protein